MIDREPFPPTPSSAAIAAARLIAPVIVRAGRPRPSVPPPPIASATRPAIPLDAGPEFEEPDGDEPSTEQLEAAARMLATDWQIDPRALLLSRGIDPTQILGDPAPPSVRSAATARDASETLLGIPVPALPIAAPTSPVPKPALPRRPAALPASVETPVATSVPAARAPLAPLAVPTNASVQEAVEIELDELTVAGLVPTRFRFPRARKHRIALLAAAAAGALVAALIIRSFPGEASSPAASGEPPNVVERSGGNRPSVASRSPTNALADQPETNAAPADTPPASPDRTKLARSAPSAKNGAKSVTAARSGAATLQISSVPAAKVTVDGRPVGMTPRTVRVDPGLHRVAFIGPNGRRSRNVTVPSGGNVNVAVRF